MALAGNSTSLASLALWSQPYARSLLSHAHSAGARTFRVTSVKRSRAQQAQLYKSFLAGRSSFPAAPPGRSKHEYGLAFDMVTEPFSALWSLGGMWKKAGGFWSPSDPIHFEPRPGMKLIR